MIDLRINKEYVDVRKMFHSDDIDFNTELLTLILTLTIINAMEHPHECDVRILNTFYSLSDGIMRLEAAMMNNKNPMYQTIKDTKALAKLYKRRKKYENKNSKEKPNGSK